jgi:chemotaxis protein methyltransferase CheR
MTAEEFTTLKNIIYDSSGIALSQDKIPLLNTRLARRLRALGLPSPKDYIQFLRGGENSEELLKLLDVVSTNTTYFHREPEHFDMFANICKNRADKGGAEFKVWCAASSSGEEPYTLSMIAHREFERSNIKCRLLATDISLTILNKAQRGIYLREHVEQLPAPLKDRYFRFFSADEENYAEVIPAVKNQLLFKRLNLSEFPYPLQGPFDVIFCRNVMIYFDNKLKEQIVTEFYRLLKPGGILFLSKTESLVAIKNSFISRGMSVYEKGI